VSLVIISILLAIVLLIVGMPVPFSFGIPIGILYFLENIKCTLIPYCGFFSVSGFTILAIPFFIYVGNLMTEGGSIKPLINFSQLLLGKCRGALAQVVVVVNIFFGAITGSGVAAVAATGSILFPSLVKEGYDKRYAAALISSAGAIGFLIPPSIPLIIYASVVEGASIAALFAGGIIPGLMLAFGFMFINYFHCRKTDAEFKTQDIPEKSSEYSKRTILISAIPALLLPVIILGGIYGGVFSPTEAAGVACFYAILIGFFVYRKLSWRKLMRLSETSATSIATILLVLFFLTALSRIFVFLHLPQHLAMAITSTITNKNLILFLVALILVVMGMLMDAISGTIVAGPLLLPLMDSLGISVTHFGVIMCTAFAMGLITPPVAPNLFVAARITGISVTEFIKDLLPFLGIFFVVLLLVLYIPALSEFLPRLFLNID